MDGLADANMDLVLTLFERGFNEEQVQEALQAQCQTLAQALAVLAPASTAAEAQASDAAASRSTVPSRRLGRKAPAAPMQAVAAVPAEQAAATSEAPAPPASAIDVTPNGEGNGISNDQRGTAQDATPPKVSLSLPAGPEIGKEWWSEAAKRWPKILAKLRLKAAAHIVRQDVSEDFAASAKSLETPGKKRSAEAEDDEHPGRRRKAEPLLCGTRPPPTPCWATPPHGASSSRDQGQQSPPPPSTPGSSPPPMKLNSNADICKICFCDTPAWRSVCLGCGHGWYCASCMQRHAEARLDMGASNICCPECTTPLPERDLRKLLPTQIIDRMLARSLEQAVSSAADIWACPTPNCPMRVALEDGELARLKCSLCRNTSCLKCGQQPYHRGLTCEENAERLKAKSKANKNAIQAEESLMQWMQETGTKQCPTCRMGVTKQNLGCQNTQYSECHKMVCRNCNTRFCFKCLSVLSDSFTCGCTIDAHGFIDPVTGKRVEHLRKRGRPGPKAAGRPGKR